MGNTSGTPAAKSVAVGPKAVDMDLVRADIIEIMASPEWMAGPGQNVNASKLLRLAWQSADANVVGKSAQGGRTGASTPPLYETSGKISGRQRTWSGQSGNSGRDEYEVTRTTTADTLGTEGSKTHGRSLSKTGSKEGRTPKIPKIDQYIKDVAFSDVESLEDLRELLAPVVLKHPGLTYTDLWSSAAHLAIKRQ